MADLHKAIRAIHNSVVSINGDTQETIVATDVNGDEVSINWTDVNAWTNSEEYKYKRENEYPSWQDQMDMLWHSIDESPELKTKFFDFYEACKAVKVKYPK